MKLLLDCRPVREPISGVARYCIGLSNALGLSFPQVDKYNLVQGPSGNKYVKQLTGEASIYLPFGSTPLGAKLFNALFEYLPGMAARASYGGDFDIVHETYFANAGRARKKVATIHDVFPIDYPEMFSARNVKYSVKNLYRQVRESSVVISVSEYTKDRVVALTGIDSDRVVVLGNAVDIKSEINWDNISTPVRTVLEDKVEFCFFVGNIEPRKNIRSMVDAFKLADLPLRLVVAGRSNYDVESAIAYANMLLGDRFCYLGAVNEDEKWALLNHMRFMIFPSHLEGFGIPVIESYAVKRPCVFSNTSALKELAFSPEQVFDPSSVEDISAAMVRAINPSPAFEDAVKKGVDYSEKFTWEYIAKKTNDVYVRVLEES